MRFCPSYRLLGLLLCPWMWVFFLVGSNILLLIVVQQQVVILEFSKEKMITRPSTLPFLDFGEVMKIMSTAFKRSHACTTALSHSVPPTCIRPPYPPHKQTYMQIHMYLYCGKQRDIFPIHRLSYSLKCYLLFCGRDYSQLAPFLKTEQWFLLGIHLLPRYISL